MTFSIIVPAFNSSNYIEETLVSLTKQSYQNFEVIIVDDGSTDNTYELSVKLLEKLGLSGKAYQRPATQVKGVSSCRNYAIEKATGAWVVFLDSDDLFHSAKLELLHNIIQEHPNTKAIHHRLLEFNDGDPVIYENIPAVWNTTMEPSLAQLVNLNTIATSSVVVKKEMFKQTGYFDTGLGGVEDYYLWLHMALYTNWLFVPLKLTGYRVRTGSLMGGRKFQHYIEQNSRLVKKISENKLFTPEQKSSVKKYFMFDVMQYYASISINQFGWMNFISGLGKLMTKGYSNYAIKIGFKHAKFTALRKLSVLKSFF